ncbi:MAG: GTP-dependent dephospho-CoA kinase family protein [Halodesulfurarchaeum sp.]
MGPIYREPAPLLQAAGKPIVSVGDVVSYHLATAGHVPKISIVDGRSERDPVADEVAAGLPEQDETVVVSNPAATITAELVRALEQALEEAGTTRIEVDGEEDLAVLPATLLCPEGATVVYGQPGEGMVAVNVDEESRETCLELLSFLDRDREFWADITRVNPGRGQ